MQVGYLGVSECPTVSVTLLPLKYAVFVAPSEAFL
jgi:hypothetical protein